LIPIIKNTKTFQIKTYSTISHSEPKLKTKIVPTTKTLPLTQMINPWKSLPSKLTLKPSENSAKPLNNKKQPIPKMINFSTLKKANKKYP
jgi:hypothetical protein